jgi:3-methyladenine DNA glycosylase Mpg
MLSADAAAQLRSAIAERWTRPNQSDDALTQALAVAAQEAKQRSLRPEELLLALKAIEEDVAVKARVADSDERDRFRFWLVGACMRAFFSQEQIGEG